MNKKKFAVAMLACVMCMSTGAALAACTPNDDTPPTGQEQTEPEKVKDGEAFGLEVGGEPRYITVRDYITLNGNTPTCSSSDEGKVAVSYDGGVVTVTPVAEGGATVTITCRSVTVTFEVTVNPLPAAKFTVTVDGKTVANLEAGSEYELPAATEATVPEDFEFLGWTVNGEDKQPGYKITVTDNVDIISNIQRKAPEKVKDGGDVAFNANGTHRITVSEYITTHGNDVTVTSSEEKITASHSDGVVTLTATEACGGTVTVACGEINITFNVTVSEDQDLSVYMLKNGGFDNGLEGWTMDGEVGEISTESTFWEQNYPVYNDGNYLAGNESGTGTVTSSAFKVGGINKITFRMGAAGNPECYITLEDEDGTVLAIWRNTKFKDETDWVKEEIGVTQFGNNLATYVADLTAHAGKTVKIVLHDNATSGFGFINLDDVVTYYASEEELPEGAFEAVNQLTVDKTALKATLDGAVAGQGDYTQESYEAYANAVGRAREVYGHVAATQAEADAAKAAIDSAADGLELRTPVMMQGAETQINLFVNKTKTLSVADYIDGNNLSKLTYEVTTESTGITLSEVESGEFTVTAGDVAVDSARVTITVKYDGEVVESCTVTLTVSVTSQATPTFKEQTVTVTKDLYTETEKQGLTLDLAANVNNPAELPLEFTVQVGDGESVSAEDGTYTYAYGEYTEDATTVNIKVTVSYTANEAPATSEYAYVLILTDTTAYRIANGGFDNGLEGWTMDGEAGEISTESTFWEQNYPVYNDGNYFAGNESGTGTVTSSAFKVGGINKITFRMGAAGNPECYITLEDEDGTVLAIWRNTKFKDETDWVKEEIGVTQFGNNLATYVADLAAHVGKTVKIVLHDNATSGFGFINLDDVVTYYASEEELPEGAFEAVNQLTVDKTVLKATLDGAVAGQGDYTQESYEAYANAVERAREVYGHVAATQAEADAAKAAIDSAADGLELRTPVMTQGAETQINLFVNKTKTLSVADYIDGNNLSKLTYEVTTESTGITLSEVESGEFTVTAGDVAVDSARVTITVKYDGEVIEGCTVTLTVSVTSQAAPTFKEQTVTVTKDLYTETEKQGLTLDLAANVNNPAELPLEFTVQVGDGESVSAEDGTYTYAYGEYTEDATTVNIKVTVSYTANEAPATSEYEYVLILTDTTAYRIANGGFDDGLEGWTGTSGTIGTADRYFATETFDGYPMNNDNGYYAGIDNGTETVTSSTFTVGGTGWITFKLGSMRPYDNGGLRNVYLEVVDVDTDTVVARVRNVLFSDPEAALKLNDYKLDLSSLNGKQVYLRAVDNEDGGDFRGIYLDKIVSYYTEGPTGDYTDLTGTRYLDGTLSLDLNGSASGTVAPVILSDGVIATPSYASVNIYADETGTPVDGLTVDGLNVTAKKSGAYRLVYNEGTVSEFTVNVTVTNSTELPAFVDKTAEINVNDSIPSIPLELKSTDERFNYSLTVDNGEVDENGNYTYNDADTSQSGVIEVTVTVKISDTQYSDEAYEDKSYKIIITVKGANISLNETKESTETYDIYDKTETEQESRTIDFAEYLIIPNGAAVTYTGTLTVDDGVATEITFTGSECTLNYADYALGETAKAFKFAVTASAGGTPVTINLTLNVKDTRAYRIANGGFDNGLEGWTLGNPDLGGVNNTETYWAGIPFNNDGNFFNAYYFDGEAKESAMGTLTSSPFTIGGSGWITYKLGGAKNADKVYLDVIEKDTGVILARYYNDAFSDNGESTEVRGCTLVAYKADLSEHKGKTVYIRLSDNAVNDYGLFFADSFVTYYQEEPTTGNIATSVAHPDTIYQLYNGGFETGDLKGWTLNGDIGYVSESDTCFSGSYDKDGTYLFSGVEDINGSYEANTGTLTSSYFTVGGSGWITFKLGGGGNTECYISVIDENGNELLRFHQQNIQDGKLILHKADLSSLMGKTVAIRIVDNASSDWGCLAVDSFVTYYESDSGLPDGAVEAPDSLASASSSDREEGATD